VASAKKEESYYFEHSLESAQVSPLSLSFLTPPPPPPTDRKL
jgi:hypothetical protein